MKKSTRIVLYTLLLLGAGILIYQFIPTKKVGSSLFDRSSVEGVLSGTVTNSSYKYVLIHLFEQDSSIWIKTEKGGRGEQLQVFDTVALVDGAFTYTYKLNKAFVYPRVIFLANDSGVCERVSFDNPYTNHPQTADGICMDRGAHIVLTIDGRNPYHSKISGSLGTDLLYKRRAEAEAKAQATQQTLLQKKKAAERAKHIQDSLQNVYNQLDTAIIIDKGKTNIYRSKIYLKPKKSPAQ